METVITNSDEETQRLGEEFAKKLKPKDVVFLIGDLGSGKTTFTKGVARGLGIETRIISPTFVIMRMHEVKSQNSKVKNIKQYSKILTLYHLDLYRLKSEKQTADIGLVDILSDRTGIVVIEWPEISQNLVSKKVWKVRFGNLDRDQREISFKYE